MTMVPEVNGDVRISIFSCSMAVLFVIKLMQSVLLKCIAAMYGSGMKLGVRNFSIFIYALGERSPVLSKVRNLGKMRNFGQHFPTFF